MGVDAARGHGAAGFFNNADHLVTYGDAGNSARNASVLDVQIAGTDAAQRDPDDGIPRILQNGSWLFLEFKCSVFDRCVCLTTSRKSATLMVAVTVEGLNPWDFVSTRLLFFYLPLIARYRQA